MKLYDAVVVGGAAVGSSIALALGQTGRRVLLLEKEAFEPHSVNSAINARTFALSYASAKIYTEMGLWPRLVAEASPIKQVQVTMQGRFGSCRLSHKQHGIDALGYVVAVEALDKALMLALEHCPTVEIKKPATLLESNALFDKWQLRFQVGSQYHEISTRLLIASDGANSPLRQAHYIDCEEKEYGHYGIMVNLCLQSLPEGVAVERFLEKGAIALLPWQSHGATCVWTMDSAEAQALIQLDDDTFSMHCQTALGRQFGKITAIGKRHLFPLRMKLAKAQSSARFLLMGNAAHSLHPIAAQGLNLSLRDIWQLKNQLDSTFLETIDLGDPEFISHYIHARKSDQRRIIFATDKIARFMASNRLSKTWRAMGITLFDSLLPLKNQFTRYSMGLS